ncbi:MULTISPECIES: YjcG family protein [Bacillus]|uniref:YjcG family protein n=1 Tax=Bacillus TaxID=1386 RepID=UPI0002DF2010|nr:MULTISPECIES: YjcG family protein [Bacillus]
MKFGIAIFPSKKLQDLVNSYRKRYDPHYSLIPPHLTLVYPFETSEANVREIVKQIEDITTNSQLIDLNILKVSSFQPVNNVIYLKVDANESLEALQKQLHNNVTDTEEEYSYVPHITLAQKLSNDEHSDILGQLSMLDFRHNEIVDRIHLLYQLDNNSWSVYETFRLGKES